MTTQRPTIGTPVTEIQVKQMRYHGPGWYVDADNDHLSFQLWAPNGDDRKFWQAAWTWVDDNHDDLGSDCSRSTFSAAKAVEQLIQCPWPGSLDVWAAILSVYRSFLGAQPDG